MSANQCLTAAMLEVGMRHEAELTFTRGEVAEYCALAGDRNAIHHDVEAARLRFPGIADIVVPGGLIQVAVTGLFGTVLPGDGSLGLSLAPERMRKPVCPGDTIRVTLEVVRVRGELVELDVDIRGAAGEAVGAARARVLAPSAAYREWWEKQRRGARD